MYRIFPVYIVNRHNNGLCHVHSHQFRHDILFRNVLPYKHVHTLLCQDNVFAKQIQDFISIFFMFMQLRKIPHTLRPEVSNPSGSVVSKAKISKIQTFFTRQF